MREGNFAGMKFQKVGEGSAISKNGLKSLFLLFEIGFESSISKTLSKLKFNKIRRFIAMSIDVTRRNN